MSSEPMMLGSAPQSPASPTTNPNFLPAFLMGDAQSTPNAINSNVSPGRNRVSGSYRLSQTPSEPKNLRQKLFNQTHNDSNASFNNSFNTVGDKAGPSGPPKQGLFDTIDHRKAPQNQTLPNMNQSMSINEQSVLFDQSFQRGTNNCFAQNTSTFDDTVNRNESVLRTDRRETLWVTIFGFPPSAISVVLAQFSACGNIIDKKYPTQGNWLHVKYNTPHEVSKALALNGKLITSNIMVGVTPFYNSSDNKENTSISYTSPIRARSLRNSFVSPHVNSPGAPNVPQKSTGLVTKAMEYVFGW